MLKTKQNKTIWAGGWGGVGTGSQKPKQKENEEKDWTGGLGDSGAL